MWPDRLSHLLSFSPWGRPGLSAGPGVWRFGFVFGPVRVQSEERQLSAQLSARLALTRRSDFPLYVATYTWQIINVEEFRDPDISDFVLPKNKKQMMLDMFESQALHDNPNTRQSVSVKSTNQNQAYKTSKSQFSQVNSTTQAVQRSDTLLQSSLQPQNQTFTQFRMFQNPSLFLWSWRTATNPQKPTQKDKKQTEVKYLEVF